MDVSAEAVHSATCRRAVARLKPSDGSEHWCYNIFAGTSHDTRTHCLSLNKAKRDLPGEYYFRRGRNRKKCLFSMPAARNDARAVNKRRSNLNRPHLKVMERPFAPVNLLLVLCPQEHAEAVQLLESCEVTLVRVHRLHQIHLLREPLTAEEGRAIHIDLDEPPQAVLDGTLALHRKARSIGNLLALENTIISHSHSPNPRLIGRHNLDTTSQTSSASCNQGEPKQSQLNGTGCRAESRIDR